MSTDERSRYALFRPRGPRLGNQSRTMVLALFSAMATSSGLAFAAARLV
ncbi:MAG: hypothetical protein M3507_10720 [Actinomycetota bacterium]|jgi:hypothetical protein|nr:hypothetical protein [Actinomycetota bacterium]